MQGQDLPIVQLGEPLEQWLARAVPVLTQVMGLDPMTSQNLAAQAWDIVNGSGGGNSPAMTFGLQGQGAGGGMSPAMGGFGQAGAMEQMPPMGGGFGGGFGGGGFGKASARPAPPWLAEEETGEETEDEEAAGDEEVAEDEEFAEDDQAAQDEEIPEGEEAAEEDMAGAAAPAAPPAIPLPPQPQAPQAPMPGAPAAPAAPMGAPMGQPMPQPITGQMNPQAQAAAQARAQDPNLGAPAMGAAPDDELDDGVDWEREFGAADPADATWEDDESWGQHLVDAAGTPQAGDQANAGAANIPQWYSEEISNFADSLARALADNGLVDQTGGSHLAATVKEMLSNFVNAFLSLKPVLTASLAPTPMPLGTGGIGQKAVKAPTLLTFLEASIHRHFTEMADLLRQNGNLTRDERIALSSAVGDMLQAFVTSLEAKLPVETLNRSPFADIEQSRHTATPTAADTAPSAWSPGQTVPPPNPNAPLQGGFRPMPQVGRLGPVAATPQAYTVRSPRNNQFAYQTRLPNGMPYQRAVDLAQAGRGCKGGKRGGKKGGKGRGQRFRYARLGKRAPVKAIAVPAFPETAETFALADLTPARIEDYIRRHADQLAVKGTSLGGWLDTRTGKVTLDVSALVKTPEKAQALAVQRNVKAFHVLHDGVTTEVAEPPQAQQPIADPSVKALARHDAWMAVKGVPGPVTKTYVHELAPMPDQVAVKSLGRNRVGGYLVMWGDPDHKDLAGEYFTPQTEELLSVFKAIGCVPLIYHHAMDDTFKSRVVGVVDVMEPDDVGLWIEAQIKAHSEYQKFIKPLVESKLLGLSSGTLPGARRVNKATGEIQRWPIVEASMTPTPMEWRMLAEWPVDHIKAVYHQAGLGDRLQRVIEGGTVDERHSLTETELAIQAEIERLALLKLKSN